MDKSALPCKFSVCVCVWGGVVCLFIIARSTMLGNIVDCYKNSEVKHLCFLTFCDFV